jgi:hypothetical protein
MTTKHHLPTLSLALLLMTTTHIPLSLAAPRDVSASTSVELRLGYLEKLLQSRTGLRLKEHQHDVAAQTEQLLADARAALARGDNQQADQLAKQGLHNIMSATQALPEDPEEINRHKKRYENLRQGLSKFTSAEADNKERFNVSETSHSYDKTQITKLVEDADAAAVKGEYEKAVSTLQEAQSLVTASLQNILNHKQLVIELDIGTPEKEYYYELRRYLGYEELIPVALDVKKPEAPVAEEMQRLGEKAKWMSEQARDKAIVQDYPVAIRMMMDATNVVREALRMAGVAM